MIALKAVTKAFWRGQKLNYIARDISTVFPSNTSVALLGRNGAGKSTLLKIIGGTMRPDSGKVLSNGRISWQIGFAGSFHPDLTGAQNTRFIARVYGVDTDSLAESVADFAELGDSFQMPFRSYSSGMKARFAFGVSMSIPFSYYLIDEVTSVGDASFRAKCTAVLTERLSGAGAIVVSHSDGMLRSMCTAGAVLENGVLTYYEDVEEAIAHHNRNMLVPPPRG
jgi:capsular polysaccharide transport system ATP-binding protein